MKTVVLGDLPPELESFIAERRALGQDLYDEMWEGDYHMAPAPHGRHAIVVAQLIGVLLPIAKRRGLFVTDAFNLGTSEHDFRVPDAGVHRALPDAVWNPTAAIVVEVRSPSDETYEKFGFYAGHGVDEIAVAEPAEGRVRWFVRHGPTTVDPAGTAAADTGSPAYVEAGSSPLLGLTATEVTAAVDWPG